MCVKDITIITVCYNEEKTIEKTLQSALAQVDIDYEFIVVDGGSIDATMSIVSSYPISRVISEPDKGLFDAMNKGVTVAKGNWICFLNSGDVFSSNTSLSDLFMVAKDCNADVVFGNGRKVNMAGSIFIDIPDSNSELLKYGPTYRHGCSITRRDKLLRFPFETGNDKYGFALDYLHIMRLYRDGGVFKYVNVFVQDYLIQGVSNDMILSLKYNYRIKVETIGWSLINMIKYYTKLIYVFIGLKKLNKAILMFFQNYLWDVLFDKIPIMSIRIIILRMLGLSFDNKIFINRYFSFFELKRIKIGRGTHINRFVFLDGRGSIDIGSNCSISHGVRILTGSHLINSTSFAEIHKPVVIADNVWIGAGATVLPGVSLGKGCVVASGAYVVKDVAPYTVVGGVPAIKIGERASNLEYSCSWSTPFI